MTRGGLNEVASQEAAFAFNHGSAILEFMKARE